MGASQFSVLERGKDAIEAFNRAVEQARYESGAGGYTGTIAEKGSFVVIQREAVSFREAEVLANKLQRDQDPRVDDKWGPAGAIPVVLTTREVTLKVPSGNVNDWRGEGSEAVVALLKEQKVLKRGESVKSVRLNSYKTPNSSYWASTRISTFTDGVATVILNKADGPTERTQTVSIVVDGSIYENRKALEATAKLKVKAKADEVVAGCRVVSSEPKIKVVTEATKGKTETRYIIEGSWAHGKWETGFASQVEARAKAVELASLGKDEPVFSVVGVTKRVDGSPLVKVTRQVTKTSAEVEVTIVKKVKPGTPADAWLFFGLASD